MHLIYDSCHVLTRRDTDPELYAITSEYLTRDYNDFCAFHAEFCNYLENVRSAESLDEKRNQENIMETIDEKVDSYVIKAGTEPKPEVETETKLEVKITNSRDARVS